MVSAKAAGVTMKAPKYWRKKERARKLLAARIDAHRTVFNSAPRLVKPED